MPSRRRVLAGSGLALAGLLGSSAVSDSRRVPLPATVSADRSTAFDWPMARYDPAGTGHNPDASGPKDDASIVWEQRLDESTYGVTAPILVRDALFTVDRQGLVALDRETGEVRFSRTGSYLSSLARADASAYRTETLAVTGSEGVYGLNAGGGYEFGGFAFGSERWHGPGRESAYSTRASPGESPVAADGSVYAIVPDTDRVVALDANSGRRRWERTIGDPRSIGSHRPAVRDGTVYVSSSAGDVAAFDAETGERRWSVTLDRSDGEITRQLLALTATGEGLVVPSRTAVSFLDPDSGDVLWEYDHGGNATEGSAAVANGVVFVTDGDGSLHAIDLETGEEVWSIDYARQVEPVVADGVLYLGYHWLNELVAIDAVTGDRRWTYETDTIGFSQPIVGDGTLYVAVTDGIVALEEAG
ncbi:PQQ-binding-like beta-propeller repeat protein [Halosolutus amylolyticus]|uniref:PQQ-binding-like beta-propeller repeat protein n=1 Tax=Halosolutus amylolyticus TaxID=2932267 RepID=A0ABD5PQX2_9EURY|nr:PQQ-binding-like beta-propeller repeat protein [Halosolutus amylolyticus]